MQVKAFAQSALEASVNKQKAKAGEAAALVTQAAADAAQVRNTGRDTMRGRGQEGGAHTSAPHGVRL